MLAAALGRGAVARASDPLGGPAWGWSPIGPEGVTDVADVADAPGDPSLVGVVAGDGTVYVSEDGGGRWTAVLEAAARPSPEDDEEPLRAVFDARVEQALQGTDLPDVTQLLEDGEAEDEVEAEQIVADRARAATRQAVEEVAAELQVRPGGFLDAADQPARVGPGRPRLRFTASDRLLVARSDGMWVSDDLGERWERVLDEPVRCLAGGPGAWWAGTGEGVRTAADPAHWDDPDDALEGLVVEALAVSGDVVYAGTSRGLWRHDPRLGWQRRGAGRTAVRAVAVDGEVPSRVWFATARGVFRSVSAGADPVPARGDVSGVEALRWLGPGTLVASTATGPRWSADGGATWHAFSGVLVDPATRAASLVGDRLWIATSAGVLARVPPGAVQPPVPTPSPPFVSLQALLRAALDRPGLREGGRRGGERWAATLVPRLRVEADWNPRARAHLPDASGQIGDRGEAWQAYTFLEWRPAGRKAESRPDVLVSDGQVLVDDGEDRGLLAALLDRRAATDRADLAARVTALYRRRAALVAQAPTRAASPLLLRAHHALDLLEAEARLDALTGGAVSRWLAARPRTGDPR